jgi:Transposase
MILRGRSVIPMARSCWTSNGGPSPCSRIGRPPPWPSGFRRIPESRGSCGIARGRMRKRRAPGLPRRARWPTASICCSIWRPCWGQYGIVALYIRRLRQAQGLTPWPRRRGPRLPAVTIAPPRPLTLRRATWLVLRSPDQYTEEDHHPLAQLTAQSPTLAEAVALAQDFAGLIRQRQPSQLDAWLTRAAPSALMPFRRFAKGLRADAAAVQAAVTLPWSQGPIEGQSNRLKRLTRQRFGRARLALLARRFLLAACSALGHPPLQHDLIGASLSSLVARALARRTAPSPHRPFAGALRRSSPNLPRR